MPEMHRKSSNLDAVDKRICSCGECSGWRPPVVDWRKRRHPKNAPSVAWRGRWWWRNKIGYYTSWDRETKRPVLLHRTMWEVHRGPILPGFHIHHIDRDKENNQLWNLEPMLAKDHAEHHGIEIEARRSKAALGSKSVVCASCGNEFVVSKLPSRKKFCSYACIRANARASRPSQARPRPRCNCQICGKSFVAIRRDAKYCSRKCSTASQDRSAYARAYYLAHPEKYVLSRDGS